MPDGDILRLGIPGHYCAAYQEMCEGVAPKSSARTLARGLRNRIQSHGPGPRELLKRMASKFAPLMQQSAPIQPQQLTQLDRMIAQERRDLNGLKEGLDIASDVCKVMLHMLQRGEVIEDLDLQMASLYVNHVLERSYDARVKVIGEHYDSTSVDTIQKRRQEIQVHLARYLNSFAKQVAHGQSTQKLRLRPTRKPRARVELDDIVE